SELRKLCDAVDYPSTKARQLIDDVATGHAYFGIDGFLPAFQPLVSLFDYFAPSVPFVIEDPVGVVQALTAELEQGRAGERSRHAAPHFAFERLYSELPELEARLGERPLLALHRGAVAAPAGQGLLAALEAAPDDAPALCIRDHADLGRAVKLARTQRG